MKLDKIVVLTGDIETLGYFSVQIGEAYKCIGHQVFIYDFLEPHNKLLREFIVPHHTTLICFNFIGLLEEDGFIEDGESLWDVQDVFCKNIVVDHPFYYHKHMKILPKRYKQFQVDRGHVGYMERFFSKIPTTFLPLAGTELPGEKKTFQERTMDVVFTGNYTPPDNFREYITRIDDEYTAFYYKIIEELIAHPYRTIEEVVEEHARREIDPLPDEDLCVIMENIIFIDLYVRFYFRGEAIKSLAKGGIQVHIYGEGWDLLQCSHKENLILHKGTDSYGCLVALADAKISLNVMPWFKDGSHDRIPNSMLQGAVCISDGSKYIHQTWEADTDIVIYELEQIEGLVEKVKHVLENEKWANQMIDNAYYKAKHDHTWDIRRRDNL